MANPRVEVIESDDDVVDNVDIKTQQQEQEPELPAQHNSAAPPGESSRARNTAAEAEEENREEEEDRSSWGAQQFKDEGNKKFASGDKEAALDLYLAGLELAQRRPRAAPKQPLNVPEPARAAASQTASTNTTTTTTPDIVKTSLQHDSEFDDVVSESSKGGDNAAAAGAAAAAAETASEQQPTEAPPTAEQLVAWTLTSQLHCNAAYMMMQMNRNEDAIAELDEAVRHDPSYLRAYQRRAQCNWDLGRHSACYADIEKAEKDLGWRLDSTWSQRKVVAKQKMDEEMQKMWGQLKELGNTILGKFGLSTDNFKFDKDPNSGGYSMRFEK